MLVLALLINLAQAQVAPPPATWLQTSEITLPAVGNPGHRQMPLQFVVQEGSKWDNLDVLNAQIAKVAGILDPCGIAIGPVEVKTVQWNPDVIDRLVKGKPRRTSPMGLYLPAEHEVSEGEMSPTRPVVMLFSMSIPSTAKAFNRKYTNLFKDYFPEVDAMLNITMLTENYIDNKPLVSADASYNTMAHELVHLFTNDGHIRVRRNLMSDYEGRGMQTGALVPSQCVQMQAFPQ